MKPGFELFVAERYLRARRKQAVISLITVISILGVAAGVMELIIALAITNGFRNTLQRTLLGATAHVSILEKTPDEGISGWRETRLKLARLPHVRSASPALYGHVLYSGPAQGQGGVLKGIQLDSGVERKELESVLREGSLDGLGRKGGLPGVVLGSRLAQQTGMMLASVVTVISPQGELTPLGPRPSYQRCRVVGIFESGFFDIDSTWAFTSLETSQRLLGLGDVVNSIELKLDDIYAAPEVAKAAEAAVDRRYAATHWMEQNRQLLNAFRMDRAVTVITIGLIQLVAALNILISLVMMVMEKNKDIAVLVSMGARAGQIRRIFMLQGLLIGAVGAALGLAAGYTISHLADRYRWIRLDEEIYSLSFVPFEPRWTDGLWVAAAALLVSWLATLYPSRAAARVLPAEALRYE